MGLGKLTVDIYSIHSRFERSSYVVLFESSFPIHSPIYLHGYCQNINLENENSFRRLVQRSENIQLNASVPKCRKRGQSFKTNNSRFENIEKNKRLRRLVSFSLV